MQIRLFIIAGLLFSGAGHAQNYTSYFTGNTTNILTAPQGGVCMMGGATESDDAMRWFLQRSTGGDILVLRTTGSNGYNSYMYSSLGVSVNSVETIVCNTAAASYEPYVLDKIKHAEAIWFAGGDQWAYISFWRNTPVDSLVNEAIASRNIVVGGTSAGMAILGKYYYSAQYGSVTSASALANPYNSLVTVDSARFIKNAWLHNVLTDTHYDNPNRMGRHITFLARVKADWGLNVKGIACDEYTAVCIDNTGLAKVYGSYPTYDDNAYFIQANCEIPGNAPEACAAGTPLTWNQTNKALKVYNVKGTVSGSNTFDMATWAGGTGGTWQHWWVVNGTLQTGNGTGINCEQLPLNILSFEAWQAGGQVVAAWRTAGSAGTRYYHVQRSSDGRYFETLKAVAAYTGSSPQTYHYADAKPLPGKAFYRLQQEDADGRLYYSAVVEINAAKNGTAISVSPNPAGHSIITINSSGSFFSKIILCNATGTAVLERRFSSATAKAVFNIAAFPAGVYFLQIYAPDGTLTKAQKLVIN